MGKRTALISVYNKEGIADFARQLADLGFKILASSGTAKVLSEAGVQVTDVASLVGGGPILGHRVVTLSREVHAGLLAKDSKEDREELKKLKIPFIDLVCVDLYPLEEEISKWTNQGQPPLSSRLRREHSPLNRGEQSGLEAVLEKTDIGGPTILRSAAKGRRIVICDPGDRNLIIEWLKAGQPEKEKIISELAAKAEFIVSQYTLASARYHSGGKLDGLLGREILSCKYGENGWQTPAGLFALTLNPSPKGRGKGEEVDPLSLSNFRLVAGTAPSYNNLADVDRLLQTITHIAAGFDVNKEMLDSRFRGNDNHGVPNIAVGVKHGNPCGAAVAEDPSVAIKKMLEGDLRAIFGGVVMVNFEIDEQLAEILLTHRIKNEPLPSGPSPIHRRPPLTDFGGQEGRGKPNKEGAMGRRLLDGVIAPKFAQKALDLLKRKGDKCRFLVNPALADLSKDSLDHHNRFRYVRGGFLRQPNYDFVLNLNNPNDPNSIRMPQTSSSGKLEIIGNLSAQQKFDLILAWAIGCTSNSNTVTLVKDQMLIGNGVGQQDRVGGCELAIKRANDAHHEIKGAVAYSDSFFPFVDGVEVLAKAGVSVVFSTSGSVRDEEVKKFCAEHNLTLVLLPDSQARGFFGH